MWEKDENFAKTSLKFRKNFLLISLLRCYNYNCKRRS
uniref:Uncharacterized protein n=1 Tax=Siphoviridae sp. ctylc9 TaxID=2827977 RepID=A0A8S5S8S4_9CAUD|nr:MAG TPA: hypothetical protein [Caudoviricetes sp.]DAF47334.1 MAG TPA: hypothetical protein [Siphoviridae sp. ctylc9]